ncbi:hypothetical protein L7F22_011638 [Adiantum nelumboides]|nr:hypothetical protein [Adiantum nelumboides]
MLEIEMMEGVHTLKAFGFFGEYAHEKRPSGGARKKPPSLVKEEVVQKKKVETFAISNASLLYFDGSYRRSHDAASGGIVVYDAQRNLVRKQGLKLDAKSNNEAEYMALEGGLHICLQMGIKRLQIKGDALLIVKQVLGVWKNKDPKLKNLCFRVKALLKKFEAWSLQHVERSQNEEAHEAAQGMMTCVFVVKTNAPLYHGREMLSREADFLLTGILPWDLLPQWITCHDGQKLKLLNKLPKKFQIKWEGPFTVVNKFDNGTYQLADLDDAEHKYRVNGYRLKKYLARLMTIVKDEMLSMDE